MKKKLIIIILALCLLLLFFVKFDITFLLKESFVKEFKKVISADVSIGKIYIHFLPLYFEVNNIYLSCSEKEKLIIKKAKIYIELSKILNKELEIKRVTVLNGNFGFNYKNLKKIIENINNLLAESTKTPLKISFKSLVIENFSGWISTEKLIINLEDCYTKIMIKPQSEISIFSNLKTISPIYPNVDVKIKTLLTIKENTVVVNEFKVFDKSSSIISSGKVDYPSFLGDFIVTGKVFIQSLLRFFGINDKTFQGELNFKGKIILQEGKDWLNKVKLNLNFDGKFFLEDMMKILKVSEKLSGYTEITNGKIEGTLEAPYVTAEVNLADGNILGVKVEKANTFAIYKNKLLEFKTVKANLYGGTADVYVWITLPVVYRHYVFVDAKNVLSDGIFELISWNPGIPKGTVTGWLTSQGERFSPKSSFVYIRKKSLTNDIRDKIEWIRGDFESDKDLYTFTNIKIATSKSLIESEGYFDNRNKYLDFTFNLKSRDLSEAVSYYQKGLYGDIEVRGRVLGNLKDPEILMNFASSQITIHLDEMKVLNLNQNLVFDNLFGRVTYKRNGLFIHNISGKDISVKGKILFPQAKNLFDFSNPLYDISFRVKNLAINKLYLKELKDTVNTYINLQGWIKDRGEIKTEITSKFVYLGDNKVFDKVETMIEFQKNTVFFRNFNIYNNGSLLKASGYLVFGGQINITGKAEIFNITRLIEKYLKKIGAKSVENIVLDNLNFEVYGLTAAPSIKLQGLITANFKNKRAIDGAFNLAYEKEHLLINSTFMKNIYLKIEGFTDKDKWILNGKFNSARFDLLSFAFTNSLPEDFLTLVDGEFKGEIFEKNLNAQISLNKVFMKMYGVGLSNREIINIDIKNGSIYFSPVTFVGQSTELKIKGKVVDYFDIFIEGTTDLKPFKTLLKVDELNGRASLQVYIYESRKNPEIVGVVDLKNTSITLQKNIPTLSDISARLSFNENRIIIEKALGTFSEGKIYMDGAIYLEKLKPKQLAISGKLSNIRWVLTPGLLAYIDGQIYLNGEIDEPLLSGQINIKKGVYTEKIDWMKFAIRSNSTKNIIHKDSWLSNLKFNLRIQTDNFFVNNNLATVNLNSDLLFRGLINEPSLIGWINAKSGWIYFRGSKFEILRLLVQFNDPNTIKPYLNVSAKTYVSQYNIMLNINGYIDQFNLILTSNPPLSDQDLLNLLVLGQNGGIKKEGTAVSEATSFITGQMQSLIEERIKGITGLDVLSVEPTLSKTTGSITPKITVGKRLMDGKMTVTYSAIAGTTGEQIIKVEYFIKKGISLVGIRDQLGGISGAIKFRFEFH